MSDQPSAAVVLAGLKTFQRATVDYVFERFYGENPTRRFLVADEVGLGKTLVARGVIARVVEHLEPSVPRIDVIYICSNADIARQNVDRLGLPNVAAQATRLTLLPLELQDLKPKGVNFVALTPGTSFEQNKGGGRIEERALLFRLLDQCWNIRGRRSALYVMQDYAQTASFERALAACDGERINKEIAKAFQASLANRIQEERSAGKPDLQSRFEDLCRTYSRSDSRVDDGASKRRTHWIGELRQLLARCCIDALEPDLVILDEFQRFRHLLEMESEAGELARDLFESEAGLGARVLLLSATPYRSLSLHHEGEDGHYADFLSLLGFLDPDGRGGHEGLLAEYRSALPGVTTADGYERLQLAKTAIELKLRRFISRTERLSEAGSGMDMLTEVRNGAHLLTTNDVLAYAGTQAIADACEHGNVVEYWKSAPYPLNFMDEYSLKERFKSATEESTLVQLVRSGESGFIDFDRVRRYEALDPANPRLRGLLSDTVGRGMWKLVWIPPTLSYYDLDGPFADPSLRNVTKRLVFSAWHMVPKAVASLVSFEAERAMMLAGARGAASTQEDWTKQAQLLRFGISDGRLAGLPLLLLIYPCATFASECDPRDAARGRRLKSQELLQRLAERIGALIAELDLEHEASGQVDERWYWIVPMLLDRRRHRVAASSWWEQQDLAQLWMGGKLQNEDASWPRHVDRAAETLRSIESGQERLGAPPPDLKEVLALAASAAPATAALRAYQRGREEEREFSSGVVTAAAQTGRAFLTLFNHPEVIAAVRGTISAAEPYWLRTLEYCHAGGLQAVLDEYVHLLRGDLSPEDANSMDGSLRIAEKLKDAVTLQTANLRVDNITAPKYARAVKVTSESMRVRFAMRFGDDRGDEDIPSGSSDVARDRKKRVRSAFNSPFWPFVLVSTSVGQEGLDFHYYCHAVTHWNLPSNPVDLEQREGRIHRYKGHAVRKNIVERHGEEALTAIGRDVWSAAFSAALAERQPDVGDLVPFWLYPGTARIERHVPVLPFSRDAERLDQLKKALVVYRMVFGQVRQEDLIAYLLEQIPEQDRAVIAAGLRMDLRPPQRNPSPHEPE